MKRLAEFTLRGLPQAVAVAAGFALLALIFPPLGIISSAAVGLIALRIGWQQALYVSLISSVVLAVAVMLLQHPPVVGLVSGIGQWLPLVALGALLGKTANWGLVMQVAFITGVVAIVLLYLLFPNIDQFWAETLQAMLRPALEQSGGTQVETVNQSLQAIAPLMSGILVSALILSSLLALMLARAMQASIENPGGFAREFQSLRIGTWPAALSILFIVLATLTQHAWANALAAVATTIFVIQGFALVHGMAAKMGWPSASLIGLYVLLVIFLTPVIMVMAGLGIVDAFADFRRRLPGPAD